MMTSLLRFALVAFLALTGSQAGAQFLRPHEPFDSTKSQSLSLTPGTLVVKGEGGAIVSHTFQFELAETDPTRSIGLMHRAEIAPDHGMLFDFKRDRMVSMWMRNTFITLDMLFLSAEGEVVTIAENTVPHSEKTVSSRVRVRAVLELAAGTVQRLAVKPGDKVTHEMFGN